MAAWWASLSPLNQAFYVLAVFFSALFGWQFLSSLGGLGADHDVSGDAGGDVMAGHVGSDVGHLDTSPDGHVLILDHGDLATADQGDGHLDGHHAVGHEADSLATFRLLSIRSLLAFGTLFSWAGALYLQRSLFPGLALLRALLWGLAGMVVVALFFWILPRLTEEGTANLDTAIGQVGSVYMEIPEDGIGQVKVRVSGAVSFVRARSRDGRYLPAGSGVRVIGRLDGSTLEVEPVEA